jgi:predicted ATPase
MVLNEPETSLHPDLLAPLARLVVQASKRTQIIAVTHSAPLITALVEAGCNSVMLEKRLGETTVIGSNEFSNPAWHWPSR